MVAPPARFTWLTQDMILELAAWQLAHIRISDEVVFIDEVGVKLPSGELRVVG